MSYDRLQNESKRFRKWVTAQHFEQNGPTGHPDHQIHVNVVSRLIQMFISIEIRHVLSTWSLVRMLCVSLKKCFICIHQRTINSASSHLATLAKMHLLYQTRNRHQSSTKSGLRFYDDVKSRQSLEGSLMLK